MACHHRLCAAQTVERRKAWHDINALGLHARSDDVGHGMTSPARTAHTVGIIGRGMTSPPLDITHGRQRRAWHAITALGLADTVGRRQAWYAITAIGRQIRSNDVGLGMP